MLPVVVVAASVIAAAESPPGAPAAVGQPPDEYLRPSFEWQTAPGAVDCPTRDDLILSVNERLGRQAFADSANPDIILHGVVGPALAADGWSAIVTLSLPTGAQLGRRTVQVTGEPCNALGRSLSVMMALLVDLRRSELPALPKQPAAPPVVAPAAGESRWGIAVGIGGGAAQGPLPGVAPGLRLHVLLSPTTAFGVEIWVTAYPRARVDHAEGGADLDAGRLGIGPCVRGRAGARTHISGCAGGEAGIVRARGFGFLENRDQWAPTVDLLVRASLDVALTPRLSVFAGAAAGTPLLHPYVAFVYAEPDAGAQILFRPAVLWSAVELGLSWRIR